MIIGILYRVVGNYRYLKKNLFFKGYFEGNYRYYLQGFLYRLVGNYEYFLHTFCHYLECFCC